LRGKTSHLERRCRRPLCSRLFLPFFRSRREALLHLFGSAVDRSSRGRPGPRRRDGRCLDFGNLDGGGRDRGGGRRRERARLLLLRRLFCLLYQRRRKWGRRISGVGWRRLRLQSGTRDDGRGGGRSSGRGSSRSCCGVDLFVTLFLLFLKGAPLPLPLLLLLLLMLLSPLLLLILGSPRLRRRRQGPGSLPRLCPLCCRCRRPPGAAALLLPLPQPETALLDLGERRLRPLLLDVRVESRCHRGLGGPPDGVEDSAVDREAGGENGF